MGHGTNLSLERVRIPKENTRESSGKDAVQLQCKLLHFGNANIMGRQPKTVAAMEWSWPKPMNQSMCAEDGRTREVAQPRSSGARGSGEVL